MDICIHCLDKHCFAISPLPNTALPATVAVAALQETLTVSPKLTNEIIAQHFLDDFVMVLPGRDNRTVSELLLFEQTRLHFLPLVCKVKMRQI